MHSGVPLEAEPYPSMDLVTLLRHVPPLLEACICDKSSALRNIRLVNKEASLVAFQALRSYTLTLRGDARDSDSRGACLLRLTCLRNLTVRLRLTGRQPECEMQQALMTEICSCVCHL